MEQNLQNCVQCDQEFDYNLEGMVTEGYIYSCEACNVAMLRNRNPRKAVRA